MCLNPLRLHIHIPVEITGIASPALVAAKKEDCVVALAAAYSMAKEEHPDRFYEYVRNESD